LFLVFDTYFLVASFGGIFEGWQQECYEAAVESLISSCLCGELEGWGFMAAEKPWLTVIPFENGNRKLYLRNQQYKKMRYISIG
jgi:hypothetical protein